ncbi:hypothetical protein AAU57_08885 [Nonlabens sp. YIK11]|uniref:hypothetical protein n=1 Tax=Nonlabens sp. YIK11 TaxID=1453349 RepID=UPI0006DCBE5F|nr:hypothetical protein [Nonlabens sp. YIK11]KQC33418.1 hypothetical protein AAU57_08885 [Nonlabens sp. YIK11]
MFSLKDLVDTPKEILGILSAFTAVPFWYICIHRFEREFFDENSFTTVIIYCSVLSFLYFFQLLWLRVTFKALPEEPNILFQGLDIVSRQIMFLCFMLTSDLVFDNFIHPIEISIPRMLIYLFASLCLAAMFDKIRLWRSKN